MLLKLFLSSKRPASARKKFDPADELIVSEEKRKKKATSTKASQVEVCLLPFFMERVPKGKQRKDLKQQGRIK